MIRLSVLCCRKPSFGGLLQLNIFFILVYNVVESPRLEGYYNFPLPHLSGSTVVESPRLESY